MELPPPPPRSGPRTEWKALLDGARADAVFAAARGCLEPDPHAEPDTCGYAVESIYLDTEDLACFARPEKLELPKYRLRRYGPRGTPIFLEEKLRRGCLVWKRRMLLAAGDLGALLGDGASIHPGLEWFRTRVRLLRLRPSLLLTYERRALLGPAGERFTIDRALRATRLDAGTLTFDEPRAARSLGAGCIAEIKFTGAATRLIGHLRALLQQEPAAYSKYRHGVRALGLDQRCERIA